MDIRWAISCSLTSSCCAVPSSARPSLALKASFTSASLTMPAATSWRTMRLSWAFWISIRFIVLGAPEARFAQLTGWYVRLYASGRLGGIRGGTHWGVGNHVKVLVRTAVEDAISVLAGVRAIRRSGGQARSRRVRMGRERMRLPVAAWMALQRAGATGGT